MIDDDYKLTIQKQERQIRSLKKELAMIKKKYSYNNIKKSVESFELMKQSKEFISLAFKLSTINNKYKSTAKQTTQKQTKDSSPTTDQFSATRTIDPVINDVLKLLETNFFNFEFQNEGQSEISINLLKNIILTYQAHIKSNSSNLSNYYQKILKIQENL